jgi:hypothetical protein
MLAVKGHLGEGGALHGTEAPLRGDKATGFDSSGHLTSRPNLLHQYITLYQYAIESKTTD